MRRVPCDAHLCQDLIQPSFPIDGNEGNLDISCEFYPALQSISIGEKNFCILVVFFDFSLQLFLCFKECKSYHFNRRGIRQVDLALGNAKTTNGIINVFESFS